MTAALLTPPVARAQVREIRRRERPRMLDELRRIYQASSDTVSSRAEILAGEIRLQKLDQHLVSLLPMLADDGTSLGWESFRPALRALRLAPGQVEADVEMAYSPENHECVHGPITLVPVVRLARRLLASGERLATIERVTWTVPLRHRMRLHIAEASAGQPPAANSAVSGRLRTSFGRALEFVGVPLTAHPLTIQRDYNRLSCGLVAGRRFSLGPEAGSLTVEFADEALAACRRAVHNRPALAAAILLDLVPIAILNWKRGRPMMCCAYRDVPLPAAGAFAAGTRLELRHRADLSHPSPRSGLWIGYYEFRYTPRQESWSTMVMAEADDIATLLRKLHS
jgi:hypothetical protein